MSARDPLVALGVITGAHGLRGELRVKLWNPESEALAARDNVVVRGPNDQPERRIELDGLRGHPKGLLVFLRGVVGREAAEALRGGEICVHRSELPAPGPGEFYLCDLAGFEVRRPDDSVVGTVERAFAYPAADVARVRVEAGIIELPLLPPYLLEVKLEQGVLIADELEDLDVEAVQQERD